MQYLRVKNWESFQHYKDRSPPWIKLHRDLLRDYHFLCLQDASKMQLMLIWLLASQLDNKIPADPEYIKAQIGIKGELNLKELIDNGFLTDDSNTLADCKQSAIVETEAETYRTDREETEEALLLFNQCAETHGFSKVQKLTAARKSKLKLRLKEAGGIDGWIVALEKISVSDFCRGQNDRGWKADFDFLVTEGSFVKLMEGKYDNNKPEDKFKSQVRELAQNGW